MHYLSFQVAKKKARQQARLGVMAGGECEKCKNLRELYERTPQEPRDYWLMTEIFVALHGGDECKAKEG